MAMAPFTLRTTHTRIAITPRPPHRCSTHLYGANNTHMRFSFYRQMIQSRDSCGCDPLLRMSSNIPANLNSQEEELRSTLSPSVQHGSETYAFASWNSHEQSIHCTCIMEIRSHGSDVHLCLCRRTTALVEYLLSGPSVLESRG